jgi:hypothetical protein
MKATTKLQLLTLSILLLPGLSGAADSGATDTFEENLTVAEAITLDVKTGSGSAAKLRSLARSRCSGVPSGAGFQTPRRLSSR